MHSQSDEEGARAEEGEGRWIKSRQEKGVCVWSGWE